MPSFKRIKLKDVAYRDLGNKRTVGACKIVACRGYWVPSRSFNQSITVERWSRSIKLARMGTKSVVVMGSVNHRQANLQMIKLWPRSGLGSETRTGQVLGAVDRPRRCRLGILSSACRASSWYPSAILSMRAFTARSFIASAAVRISSARFRQYSGLCKRSRVVIAATS